MRIFCGTDIIEIARIKENIEDKNIGEKFKQRIFTDKEIEYCESKKNQRYQHYAARFAAKEAAFKAVSKFVEDKYEVNWKDIEVINDKQGRPEINIHKLNITNIENIDISISHCKEFATATVVVTSNIEGKGK